jgi:hypothetical protein
MLTVEELQKPRSPKELNKYFLSTYDNATPEERCRGRLKEGLWKYFFHELTVLNIFSNWKFPDDDVIVEYIIGNQGYDVKITNRLIVEYIEITFPILGEQDKSEAIEVNRTGYSCGIRSLSELKRRFTCTAESKSKKDYSYPASSLIFALDMFHLPKMNSESNGIVSAFIKILRNFQFNAKSVYLVLINTNQPDINKKVCVVK